MLRLSLNKLELVCVYRNLSDPARSTRRSVAFVSEARDSLEHRRVTANIQCERVEQSFIEVSATILRASPYRNSKVLNFKSEMVIP